MSEIKNSPFVVSICSGKGGVGKSVLASNIAQLASKKAKVLLWDADMNFPNLHIITGVEPPVRVSEVYTGKINVNAAIFKISDKFHLLADTPANGARSYNNSQAILRVFEDIVLNTDYDLVIIDTPAGGSEDVLQCCNIADLVQIVVTDEPTSIIDAYGLIKLLLNMIPKNYINLLVNNVIDIEDADEISSKLNLATTKFLSTKLDVSGFVPYERQVRQSILQQELFTVIDAKSEVSQALSKIVTKILKKAKSSLVKVNS